MPTRGGSAPSPPPGPGRERGAMSDTRTTGATPPAAAEPPAQPGAERLSVTGVSKHYGAVGAIRNADMTVHAGTVHALVGENGAGKSTLIKILSGAAPADTGKI